MHVALGLPVGDGPAGHPKMISPQGGHSDPARSFGRLQPPSSRGISCAAAWFGLRSGPRPSHQPNRAPTRATAVVAGPAIPTDAPQSVARRARAAAATRSRQCRPETEAASRPSATRHSASLAMTSARFRSMPSRQISLPRSRRPSPWGRPYRPVNCCPSDLLSMLEDRCRNPAQLSMSASCGAS